MNRIIKKFLDLTDYTYTYGDEDELKKHLPDNINSDEFGNFFIKIGENSETMFCSHLDTAAFEKQKVQHDFWKTEGQLFVGTKGDIIKRTYKNKKGESIEYGAKEGTLLGADDKAGVVIMLNMIENNIPGLYYFFVGEEVGRIGSTHALKKYKDIFKSYKRCIAFDRRGYGSIISRQMGMQCCSNDFVNELSIQFKKHGMKFENDPTGIYTDSATFMSIIPECTNLSVGYFDEHTEFESQNLTYLIKLANTCTKIDWESLPTKRNPNPFKTEDPKRKPKTQGDLTDDELWDIFIDVDDILESIADVYCKNYKDFIPEKEMIYYDYNTENLTSVWIHEDGSITVDNQTFRDYNDLKEALLFYFDYNEKDDNYVDIDDDDDDDDYVDVDDDDDDFNFKNNMEKMSNEFTNKLDMTKFLEDIIIYVDSKNNNEISAANMQKILDKYNKKIESIIYWIYYNGNDPDKTYGITWDNDNNIFKIYTN